MVKKYFVIIFVCLSLIGTAFAGDKCDKGNKKECFCECDTIKANAKGEGPCAATEKNNGWCSISYKGSTGSLGENSMGKEGVYTNFRPQDLGVSTEFPSLPDHRTQAYADTVIAYNSNIKWWDPNSRYELAENAEGNILMFLWMRASYISSRELSSDVIEALDYIISHLLVERKVNHYFWGIHHDSTSMDLSTMKFTAKGFVRPGYFRVDYQDMTVRLIYRDLLDQ